MTQEPQLGLFGEGELPETAGPQAPYKTIYVHFEEVEDVRAFGELIGQPISMATKAIFYPAGDLRTEVQSLRMAPDETGEETSG